MRHLVGEKLIHPLSILSSVLHVVSLCSF